MAYVLFASIQKEPKNKGKREVFRLLSMIQLWFKFSYAGNY